MKDNSPEFPQLRRSSFSACVLLCASSVLRTACTCVHKLELVGSRTITKLCEQSKNSKNF